MNQQDMELIERYLNDKLPAEEKLQAEQRISDDQEFRRRLEVFREYRQMHSEDSQAFRELLQEVGQEYWQSQKPQKNYWLIAASLGAICLLAAAYFLFLKPAPLPETLYAQYFSLPVDNLTVRGDESQQLLNEAMALYNDEQFAEAQQRFEAWEAQHTDSIPVIFYSAMSQMALGEMQPAIAKLKKIMLDRSADPSYSAASRWYLALAYLKSDQANEARELLEQLATGSSSYAEKAQNLLDQL